MLTVLYIFEANLQVAQKVEKIDTNQIELELELWGPMAP